MSGSRAGSGRRSSGRNPLRGPTDGIGNSVYAVAVISDDRTRLFGEDMVCFRESKGMVHARTRSVLKAEQEKQRSADQQRRDLFTLEENPKHPIATTAGRYPVGALTRLEEQLRNID